VDQTPKALGIAGIGLGALTALTNTFGLLTQSLAKDMLGGLGRWMDRLPSRPGQPRPGEMMEQVAEAMDAARPYQIAQSTGMLLFSAALVVIGIAVLQRKPWSRKAAMGWAAAALAFLPVLIWLRAFVIQPITQQAVAQAMPPVHGSSETQLRSFMHTFQAATAVMGTLTFYAPFPVLLLLLLRREKAKAWFAPPRADDDAADGADPRTGGAAAP